MDEKLFRYNIKDLADDMEVTLETLSSLYSEFFHEMKSNIEESRILCSSEDWGKLRRVIHNIKGISNCLNVNDIYQISHKLDIDLKDEEYENASLELNSISDLFNQSEVDIREFFKKNGVII